MCSDCKKNKKACKCKHVSKGIPKGLLGISEAAGAAKKTVSVGRHLKPVTPNRLKPVPGFPGGAHRAGVPGNSKPLTTLKKSDTISAFGVEHDRARRLGGK